MELHYLLKRYSLGYDMSDSADLKLDWYMYDCLQFAITSLRDEMNDGDLVVEDSDFLSALARLEKSLIDVERELKENA